ncbi:MAG: type I-E CRISPR-associated protein Cas6/Cse3/CasE [Clostridiales bacterium]|nr:type I-E CRISPR-associated protein Cas6/Cse3/CasE [Clostridiales bacterium]
MFLSRILLDDTNRDTMRALTVPQLMHAAVEQSFSGDRQRRLWRVDRLEGKCQLLVLSEGTPDFTALVNQFGNPVIAPTWETKDYNKLLARLAQGQLWRFRLRANPVHSVKEKDAPGRGKVTAHVTQEQQKKWLIARAQACGFALQPDAFDVVHTQWLKFNKGGGREVTLRTATFEGILTITDPERFKDALLSGIGRAKAYGCGLMTVMSCRG